MTSAIDIYNQALLRSKPIAENISKGDSEIQKFYKDSVIFITGVTGYLAKQLVEKLLRSCEIRRVYVLLRPKKAVPPQKRLQDILKDVVYDDLRSKKPNFEDKIVPIAGDINELGLGISEDDFKMIAEEVEIIIHSAAMVNFNAPLAKVAISNIRGTREILKLAHGCKKLRSFVHVSTAYTHSTKSRCNQEVLETFYQCPVPPDVMIKMAEEFDEMRLKAIQEKLMDDWPNVYTFTKAITEELIRQNAGNIPACIVRPSTVLCSYSEPYPGWVDKITLNGATGITHDITTGILHVFKAKNQVRVDYVPVDFVNNATIACAWETAQRFDNGDTDIKIYNICSGEFKRPWSELSHTIYVEALRYISPRAAWYPFCFNIHQEWLYQLLIIFYHFIPGYIIDAYCNLTGRSSDYVKHYKRIYKVSQVLQFFMCNEWAFGVSNTENLYRKLSKWDQSIYNFDMSTINWREFQLLWVIGIRNFIIVDGIGKSKNIKILNMQKYLTYFITCFYVLLFILLYCFMYFVFNFIFKLFYSFV